MRAIDSSILVKFFSREEGWERATEYIVGGAVTLDLALKELANALLKKVIGEEMEPSIAEEILEDLVKAKPIKIEDQDRYIVEAFRIAVKHRITVYDSLFIALARENNIELVTADAKQADIAREEGVGVVLI